MEDAALEMTTIRAVAAARFRAIGREVGLFPFVERTSSSRRS